MRRALAAAILGLSLWVGSLAWTGFVLTRTVLDPGRSEAVAEALYDDDAVRAQLAENLAGAIEAALPPAAGIPRAELDATAVEVLDSPAVEAVFVDALVRTHAAFLGEGEAPEALEAGAFGAAAREALVEDRPELDAVLPPAPELRVPLPTERIPDLGPVREVVGAAVPLLASAAGAGALLALAVTSDRPAVIRRGGFWAVGLGTAVLVFAYGIPALAQRVVPDQSAIVAALVGAMAAATRGPALALAGTGLVAIALSFLWRAFPSIADAPEPAAVGPVDRASSRPTSPAPLLRRRDLPTPARRPASPVGDATVSMPTGAAPTGVGPTGVGPMGVEPTGVGPRRPRVGGGGRVVDATEVIPAEARWVPGVGYVVDD